MKRTPTGKKISQKVKGLSTAEERERIARKHVEESCACEGIVVTPAADEKAKAILAACESHSIS